MRNMLKSKELAVEEKRKLFDEAIGLKKKGFGYKRASKILNISQWTLANWMTRNQNPLTNINLVNLRPSPELSFVIGVSEGDASCFKTSRNSYRISLACKDLDLMKKFNLYIKKITGIKYPIWIERPNFYKTQGSSKEFYEFFNKKNLIIENVQQFPVEFIQGFMDSEGWVDTYSKRICCGNIKQYRIKLVQKMLMKLGIQSKIYVRKLKSGNLFYELRISKKENIYRFYKKIGFSIQRKNIAIKEVLNSYAI